MHYFHLQMQTQALLEPARDYQLWANNNTLCIYMWSWPLTVSLKQFALNLTQKKNVLIFILTNEPIQVEHYSKATSGLFPSERGYSSIWHQLYISLQLITKNDQQCSCPQKAPFYLIHPSPLSPTRPPPAHTVSPSSMPPCPSSQIEIQGQSYNLKQSFQRMDCLARQGNYLDLKFQDNGDYYLINSFLGLGKNDDDAFIDDLIQDAPQGEIPKEGVAGEDFAGQVVREAAEYLCFRTTSLREIMDYLAQYYRVPPQKHREVLAAARKLKLKLKRNHARLRTPITDQRPPVDQPAGAPLELKVEQSQVSPFVFSEESQETRKKKRNRMSAQNSRDRKKEYIRQIQDQNRELKRRLAHVQRGSRTQLGSKDFLKMILCLGITCYANLEKAAHQIPPSLVLPVEEKIIPEQLNPSSSQGKALTLIEQGLPAEMHLLNPWQQSAILELIETMGENRPEGGRTAESGLQCTDLVSEAPSERSTSSEGCRKLHQTHYL